MKRMVIFTAIILLPLAITACNTMAGAGQDISNGGQAIEHSADEHRGY